MGGKLFKSCACSDKVEPENEAKEIERGHKPFVSYRTCTDVIWLIVLLIFMIPLAGLLIYCIRFGDIYRIINGYDRCGNVCGRVTDRFGVAPNDPRFTCLGADMTKRKFLMVRGAGTKDGEMESIINRECLASCAGTFGYKEFLNRCIPEKTVDQVNIFFSKTGISNFFQEVSEDLDLCWREILALCFIALVFSVILLLVLQFAVGLAVWLILGAVVVVCFIAKVYLWVQWSRQRDKLIEDYRYSTQSASDIEIRNINSYLGFATAVSYITMIILLLVILVVISSRVRLVVQLFKEAAKVIADIPSLLIVPCVTFTVLGCIIALWLWLALWIESSGILTSENSTNFKYKKNGIIMLTRWYNLLAMFWLTQFAINIQHMVVAGTVAMRYFTRNKYELRCTVLKSAICTVKYHLGSVCLGSILVPIIQILRVILQGMHNRTVYIEIAMRGCNFWEGRYRTLWLIDSNVRIATIKSVGDFVLFFGKVAVVLSTMLVGIELIQSKAGVQHMWVPITLACLFSYLVAHTFMSIYGMTIDTILICFCEDCELNDGINKPYFMSQIIREFAEESGGLTRPPIAINQRATRRGTTDLK